jgi:hypothetical protein
MKKNNDLVFFFFKRMKKQLLALLFFVPFFVQAQTISPSPYFTFGKGIGIISPDSLYLLNIRFRVQNRAALSHRKCKRFFY